MVSRTSCEVVLAAAKALSAAWLSEHIAIEAFTSSHHHHHHHHVACPMVDVAVPTSLLHACRF